MRAVLGWAVALVAGAFMGAAVYQAVLTDPTPRSAVATVVPSAEGTPEAVPTLYRTEVVTVVDPTPTITVEEEVVVTRTVQPTPAPDRVSSTRSAAESKPSSSQSREDDSDGSPIAAGDREDAEDDRAEEHRSDDRHPESGDD
jgi:hypothetical protein